ncbi:signal peptidase I [Marinilactibacillus kalidii]|uniref:signal peptidase I n=1 Tax=Marinilactibacillus kalidii TaxID=2820274 RepID=UPI001ABE252E|nr:signal peptidase I [Marinilactibacillus kalidii]
MSDQQVDETGFVPRKVKHQDKKNQTKKKSFFQEVVSTLIYIAVVSVAILLFQKYVYASVTVDGESMAPTLENGDKLILNKFNDVNRFDIIVFPAPDEPEKQYIKRVIGIPGDEIRYSNETLYLNGKEVEEPYLDRLDELDQPEFSGTIDEFSLESLQGVQEVPEDEYFVMGDNRGNSRDSRYFGFVSEESVTGVTTYRVWPFNDFGRIDEAD